MCNVITVIRLQGVGDQVIQEGVCGRGKLEKGMGRRGYRGKIEKGEKSEREIKGK